MRTHESPIQRTSFGVTCPGAQVRAVPPVSEVDRLAVAGGHGGKGHDEPDDAPDARRRRHAADVTIRAMTSSGALLVALFFQSPIDPAGAAPQATRARLELRGAADCISRSELAARVAARSSRIQFVDEAAISANVALTSARAGNVVAELVLTAAGIEPAPRRIVARSCAEAADAVALMIAVTLDPTLKRKSATGAAGADTAGGGAARRMPGPPRRRRRP